MKKNKKGISVLYAVLCASLFLMCSCSGSSGSSSQSEGTGSIAFSIQLPAEPFLEEAGNEVLYKAASIDCDRLGIVSVEAEVYDENEELIARGGPWECSLGEGIIYGVKAGNNRTVLLFLRDENHIARYSGNKSEIRVIAGQTTDIGTIIVIEGEEEDNQLPIAVDDSASVVRGGSVSVLDTEYDSILANDSDADGDSLAVNTTPVSGPGSGSLVLHQDGTFTYTHDGSETQSDSFTYEISDGRGGSATAVVTIAVSLDPEDNHAPNLTNGVVTPEFGVAQEIFTYSVHYRDIDGHAASDRSVYIDGVPYTMSLTSGTVYDGTYTYQTTLSVDDHVYSFLFSDGYGGTVRLPVSEMYTGPGVRAVNNAPVAGDDGASTVRGGRILANVLDNDYDPDSDDLTVDTMPVNGPDHGSLVLNQDGTYTYAHDGTDTASDSFTYEVTDGWGGSASATVTITVSLDPQDNHSPVLTNRGVSPGAGDVSETFAFSVYYHDDDGHAAQEKRIYLDGAPYDMVLSLGDAFGSTYTFETDLPLGSHEYYFTFTDGFGGSARLPGTGTYQGPCVAAMAYFVSSSKGSDAYEGIRAYPFATIGHAIDVAQGSEDVPATIFVASGSYAENLVQDSWEAISGGWLEDFSQRWDFSNNGITPSHEYETVIDGGQAGRCVTAVLAEGVSLSGLSLFNGNAGDDLQGGSAIYLSSCSADISFCTIVDNTTISENNIHGGAMYNEGSEPTITRCLFADNTVTGPHIKHGGAIYNYQSAPRITGCIFRNNHAGCNMGAGGAIYNFESDAEIIDSVFDGNNTGGCYSYGAGIYNESSDPLIVNCIFTANSASGYCTARGGAVYNNSSSPIIANCSFSLNSALNADGNSRGGGIYNDEASTPVITNAILWGDTAHFGTEIFNENPSICEITYCDIDQALTNSETVHDNIREDPLFVDASGGDLHLGGDSPCIDAGSNDVPWLLQADFEGDPRIVNDAVDMGADEYVDGNAQ